MTSMMINDDEKDNHHHDRIIRVDEGHSLNPTSPTIASGHVDNHGAFGVLPSSWLAWSSFSSSSLSSLCPMLPRRVHFGVFSTSCFVPPTLSSVRTWPALSYIIRLPSWKIGWWQNVTHRQTDATSAWYIKLKTIRKKGKKNLEKIGTSWRKKVEKIGNKLNWMMTKRDTQTDRQQTDTTSA